VQRTSRKSLQLIGVLALIALALCGYGFFLADPGSVATAYSDFGPYFLARKQELWNSLQAGHGMPFWQDDQLSGGPAYSNPQAQYLNPLHILFWLMPAARALAPTAFLMLLAAGVSMWILGGALRLRFWPRLLAASALLFSPKYLLAVYAGWLAYVPTMALLPLLYAGILYNLRKPTPRRLALTAIAGGLCLVSGMAQLVYYSLYFIAALVLIDRKLHRIWWLVLAGALGVGVAAHQLVPFLAERTLYLRQHVTYAQFLAGHYPARSLLTLIAPRDGLEIWEDSAHFGYAALFFALLAMVRRRPWAMTFGAFLLATLLFGLDTPALRFFYEWLPGMQLFRLPARVLFIGAIFCAVLAGLGAQRLPRWVCALGILAITTQGAIGARKLFAHRQPEAIDPHPDYAPLIAGSDHRIATAGRTLLIPGWAASLNVQLISGYDPLALRTYQRYFQLLQRNLPGEPVNHGVWTDLGSVARWDLFDQLGVRFVLAPASSKAPPRLQFVQTFEKQPELAMYSGVFHRDISVWRNPGELPRARLMEAVLRVPTEDHAADALQGLDAVKAAVIESEGEPASAPLEAGEVVQIVEQHPGAFELSAHASRSRLLLIAEPWHPGWLATLDGKATKVEKADVALMGVEVPAGEHRVTLKFRPLFLWPSVLLSALSLLVCLALIMRPDPVKRPLPF
jgi:hypothetical protein